MKELRGQNYLISKGLHDVRRRKDSMKRKNYGLRGKSVVSFHINQFRLSFCHFCFSESSVRGRTKV
jgi:hypothetical protein